MERHDTFEEVLTAQLIPVLWQQNFLVEEGASLLSEEPNAIDREKGRGL